MLTHIISCLKYYFYGRPGKPKWTLLLFLCPKTMDVLQQEQSSTRHHHPHPHAFYRTLLSDCNIFLNCHSPACRLVEPISFAFWSTWKRCKTLLRDAKGFLSLCCGYFQIFGKLGYKSHPNILSTLNLRLRKRAYLLIILFLFCFSFWLT